LVLITLARALRLRGQRRASRGRGRHPSLSMREIFEDYAGDLLREIGGSPDRALSAV
jgi:hypothetical protein